MADISVTAANVAKGALATVREGIAGATITAGQPLYEDSSDSFALKPAQGNADKNKVVGIALHGASDGQPVKYVVSGQLTIGAGALVLGQTYVASAAAAGGIAPISDLGSGAYPTILGIAITTAILAVNIQVGGVAKP